MSVSGILFKSFYWKAFHFLISFLTTIALAHILKPAGTASFYSLLYLFALIISFFSFGLDISLNYFIVRKQLGSRTASRIILIIAAIALLIALPCIYFFYTPGVAVIFSIKDILFFAGLQIAGGILTSLAGSIFTAHHHNYIATKILVVFSVAFLITTLIVSYFPSIRINTIIFYIWYIAIFIQGLYMFLYSYYKYPEAVIQERVIVLLKKVFRFSFAAFVVNFIFFASGKLPALIIPYWVTANEAGNYIQAYKLLEYAGAVVAFIYFPMVAVAAREEEGNSEKIVLLLVRLFNTITVTGSIVLVLLGKIAFPFIFGYSFISMYGVFICLIPALIASCSSAFFTAYFFGKGYLKYNLLSACILLMSLLLLLYPLTKMYGIKGAAVALSAGSILSIAVDIYYYRKKYNCQLTDMLFVTKKDISLIYSYFSS
jgi:O-antigen/teichoic acid export membrane protein